MKSFRLVADGTQNKQLNTPNILTFFIVESLCKDEKIPARKVVYMIDGVIQDMNYHVRGSSKVELPSAKTDKLEEVNYFSKTLKNVLGF